MRRALMLALLLAGCAQVLGIEDKKLEEDAAVGDKDAGVGKDAFVDPDSGILTSADCAEYCALSERWCTAEAKMQLFQTRDTCLSVCNKYPTDSSPTGDTLACRLGLLRSLARAGSNEAATYCPGAGPGGGPPPNAPNGSRCGSDCEGFCKLRAATCPPTEGDVNCMGKCAALVDDKVYNAAEDFGGGQDSLSCRIAHLSAAALYDTIDPPDDAGMKSNRDQHCDHSGIRSEVQCDFPMDKAPDCESYCKIVQTACTMEKAVYETTDQCMAACGLMADGTSADTSALGSKRCYRSGAYDALEGVSGGCQRASIAGDGCLGGRVASYCYFAQKACPDAFKAAYPGDTPAECVAANRDLPGSETGGAYSLMLELTNGGNNLACRLKQLTRAIGGAGGSTCDAALGLADPCR